MLFALLALAPLTLAVSSHSMIASKSTDHQSPLLPRQQASSSTFASSSSSSPASSASASASSSAAPGSDGTVGYCAFSCVSHAQNAQLECAPYDTLCFCQSETIRDYLDLCFEAACPEDERDLAHNYLDNFCGAIGGPTESSAASGLVTSARPASSGVATATGAAATPYASAAATPATQPAGSVVSRVPALSAALPSNAVSAA